MPARKVKAKPVGNVTPICGPTSLEVPLYPRSAQMLLDILEDTLYAKSGVPTYALIDLDNLRHQLRAHLQRVAIGE